MVPGQPIAQPERQREHPLPDRHVGQDGIHEVSGALDHTAPAAAGTEPSPLARERHQPLRAAAATPEAGEAAGEPAAPQEVAELILDESREPLAGSQAPGIGTEGLPMFLNDPVQQAFARTTRFAGRRAGHAALHGERRASFRAPRLGQSGAVARRDCQFLRRVPSERIENSGTSQRPVRRAHGNASVGRFACRRTPIVRVCPAPGASRTLNHGPFTVVRRPPLVTVAA